MDMKVRIGAHQVALKGPRPIRRPSSPDWIVVCTALFIIGNGISVCLGWWTHTPLLVQLLASDAPTHFNTAFGFILLGLAELGLALDRRTIVKGVRPETPVVLLTGWGHRMLEENERPPNVDRVLGKPPKLIMLRAALGELTNPKPA
jgi:hypothetical protein